jgi:hypothetical protein
MIPLHAEHDHFIFSFSINFLIPFFLMHLRFSISLILYFVLYLLSKCFRFLQGKSVHSKQNFTLLFLICPQFLILHLAILTGISVLRNLHPGHLFFSRKYAEQIPQFIPQGAISEDFIVIYFLLAKAAPTAILIAGIAKYLKPICVK